MATIASAMKELCDHSETRTRKVTGAAPVMLRHVCTLIMT